MAKPFSYVGRLWHFDSREGAERIVNKHMNFAPSREMLELGCHLQEIGVIPA